MRAAYMWQKLGDNPECGQHGVLSPVNSYGGQPAGRKGCRRFATLTPINISKQCKQDSSFYLFLYNEKMHFILFFHIYGYA